MRSKECRGNEKKRLFTRKSQVFSLDASIAVLSFIFIMTLFLWGWNMSITKISENHLSDDLNSIAIYASRSLVESGGNPGNWHSLSGADFTKDSISSLGLSSSVGYLSESKIAALQDLNATKYSEIKSILGVLGPNYELYISFDKFDDVSYEVDYKTFGKKQSNSKNIIKVKRFFIYDNSKDYGVMHLYVSEVHN